MFIKLTSCHDVFCNWKSLSILEVWKSITFDAVVTLFGHNCACSVPTVQRFCQHLKIECHYQHGEIALIHFVNKYPRRCCACLPSATCRKRPSHCREPGIKRYMSCLLLWRRCIFVEKFCIANLPVMLKQIVNKNHVDVIIKTEDNVSKKKPSQHIVTIKVTG